MCVLADELMMMCDIEQLFVYQLKAALKDRGEDISGNKIALKQRLNALLRENEENPKSFPLSTSEYFDNTVKTEYSATANPPMEFVDVDASNVSAQWEEWLKEFTYYITALGISNPERKLALLLNTVGKPVREIYSTLDATDATTYEDACKLLTTRFDIKRNIWIERLNFGEAHHDMNESTKAYVTRLRILAKHCKFDDVESRILEQLILHARDPKLRSKYLETENLDLQAALKLADVHESQIVNKEKFKSAKCEETKGAGIVDAIASTSQGYQGRRKGKRKQRTHTDRPTRGADLRADTGCSQKVVNTSFRCFRCNSSSHLANFDRCPALNVACETCKKKGHYTNFCKSTKLHVLSLSPVESSTMRTSPSDNRPYVSLSLNGGPEVEFLVDSGAQVSLLPERVFDQLPSLDNKLIRNSSKSPICTYNGEAINTTGSIECSAELNDKKADIKFLVVKEDNSLYKMVGLLGADSITKLGLSIHTNQAGGLNVSNITVKPNNYIKGYAHRIRLKPNAQPVVQKVRNLPYKLREKVAIHLDQLEQQGIVKKYRVLNT